jgi:hypothetical protein
VPGQRHREAPLLIFSITKDYSAARGLRHWLEPPDQRVANLVRGHRLGARGPGRDRRRACLRDRVNEHDVYKIGLQN